MTNYERILPAYKFIFGNHPMFETPDSLANFILTYVGDSCEYCPICNDSDYCSSGSGECERDLFHWLNAEAKPDAPIAATIQGDKFVEYISDPQLTEKLCCGASTVKAWVRRGQIKLAFRLGRNKYFLADTVWPARKVRGIPRQDQGLEWTQMED